MKYIDKIFYVLGSRVVEIIEISGFTILLLAKATFYCKNAFDKRKEIFKQMYIAGVKSLLVCSLVAVFVGMILALQTGIE